LSQQLATLYTIQNNSLKSFQSVIIDPWQKR
jgi:hypothetical protein